MNQFTALPRVAFFHSKNQLDPFSEIRVKMSATARKRLFIHNETNNNNNSVTGT